MRKLVVVSLLCSVWLTSAVPASEARPGTITNPGKGGGQCRGLVKGLAAGPPDPGGVGIFDVGQTEYNLSVGGYVSPTLGAEWPIEERAVVFYPRPLSCGPFPVILVVHGGHGTCYDEDDNYRQDWPCPADIPIPIPSFRGYDYLGERLASNGFVVVSISANGINAAMLGSSEDWNEARGELMQHHLDILQQMNTSNGPALGGLLKDKLNLQKVGTLGHSRGGEAAVRHVRINADEGSPYGIKGVFLLAPTISDEQLVTDIPLAVLLPYCDGDQEDLNGTGYYDGARYALPGDSAPKYSFEVMGANHNYFNTYWDDNLFAGPGAKDDALDTIFEDLVCLTGTPAWPRLSSAEQQGSLIATASSFFRVHLRGENNFRKYLKGDKAPPPSAMTEQIYAAYHPVDDPAERLDINRIDVADNDLVNTLGGDVTPSENLSSTLCVPWSDEATPGCLALPPDDFFIYSRAPHANNNEHRANQMRLGWRPAREPAWWENEIPAQASDFSRYGYIQMRAFVDFYDTRNTFGQSQDFSIEIEDGAGLTARVAVSDHSDSLFFPPSSPDPITFPDITPHAVLNTVRVPLSEFDDVFLTDVRAVRLVFDRTPQGAINVTDFALADPAENLSPVVACAAEDDSLVPNGMLVDVGLDVTFDDPDGSGLGLLDLDVFSDQDDDLQPGDADAVVVGDALQLKGERDPDVGGRVYLVASRAVDGDGAQGFGCCAVTVPGGDATTATRAADALAQCTAFVAAGADLALPPAGYHRVGE